MREWLTPLIIIFVFTLYYIIDGILSILRNKKEKDMHNSLIQKMKQVVEKLEEYNADNK